MTELYLRLSNWLNGLKDEEGQGLVEYGLIIALIAIVCIAGLTFLAPKINSTFSGIGNSLTGS